MALMLFFWQQALAIMLAMLSLAAGVYLNGVPGSLRPRICDLRRDLRRSGDDRFFRLCTPSRRVRRNLRVPVVNTSSGASSSLSILAIS